MHSFYRLLTLSFCHLSFSVPVFPSFHPSRSSTFCCWWDTAGALERSTSMKSLWTEATHTQTHSLPGSEQEWAESDDRERRPAERQWNKKQKAPLSFRLSSRSHFKFSLLFLLRSSLLFFLASDPLRRIAAVKLLTSSSTSVMTLTLQRNSVCVAVSQRVFDVFIRLSHDLGLNQGFRKEGESLLSCVFLLVPFALNDEPPAGEGRLCIDAFCCQWPSFSPSHVPFNI